MDRKAEGRCDRCGHPIEVVATVMPLHGSPGVFAWVCPACNAADSVLVYDRSERPWGACGEVRTAQSISQP